MIEIKSIEVLRDEAKELGIMHHPSIGIAKLQAKINDYKKSLKTQLEAENSDSPVKYEEKLVTPKQSKTLPYVSDKVLKQRPPETEQQRNSRIRKEAIKLIRIRITCMNPNKKDWPGEIFMVGNSVVGTLKKYVPFNAEAGWHVPKMIFDVIKSRKFQLFSQVKDSRGRMQQKGKLVPEFAVDVLPPLTPAQLKELAAQQALNHSIDR